MATIPTPITSPEVRNSLSTPSEINTNSLITLQVGDRRFTTRANTLTDESPVFSSLLSTPACSSTSCATSAPAVFYDRSNGHDSYLYTAVLQQARYSQIDRLERWIAEKRYHQVVRVQRFASVERGADGFNETLGTDVEVERHPTWRTEKVYVCPRGIASHRGNPDACGRMCRSRQGEADPEFADEDVLKIVKVCKRIIFDHNMCFDG